MSEVKETEILPPPQDQQEESWENMEKPNELIPLDGGENVPLEGDDPPRPEKTTKLKIAFFGSNPGIDAARIVYESDMITTSDFDDLEEMIKWQPQVIYVAWENKFMKNGQPDDMPMMEFFQKISYECPAGICFKSPLTSETYRRLGEYCGLGWIDKKFVYMPDIADTVDEILRQDRLIVGGSENSTRALLDIIRNNSALSMREVLVEGVETVIAYKMAVSGFQAVKQTYFNQLFDFALEEMNVSPYALRRIVIDTPQVKDPLNTLPTRLRASTEDLTAKQLRALSGEYRNEDIRMFLSATDKMPILEECVNLKNLK